MTRFLLGCMALVIGVAGFADNSQGIAFSEGRIRTSRGTVALTDFWVASTDAGIYGHFWFGEKQEEVRSSKIVVEIRMNRFYGFSCEDFYAAFYGEGYVNGTPRIILVQAQDGYFYPDLFAVAAFHPISGNLLYDRWGVYTRGGVSVLCELPGGGDN